MPAYIIDYRTKHDAHLLLCSDGLSDVVPDDTLRRFLAAERRPAGAASRLVMAALASGTRDDVTAVVADVTPAGWADPAGPVLVGAAAPG